MTDRNDTYFGRALLDAEPAGGRFAQQSQTRVTGAEPSAVPALPANSPWAHDPLPPEPPLGECVDNNFDPVGTPAEIEASLRSAADDALPPAAPRRSFRRI